MPGFTSPYPNLGLTALATQSIDPGMVWQLNLGKYGEKSESFTTHAIQLTALAFQSIEPGMVWHLDLRKYGEKYESFTTHAFQT